MRIGLAIECLDPRLGGAELWTSQFAAWLVRQGHEVHVVAQDFSPNAAGLGIVAHPLGRFHSRVAFAEAAERQFGRLELDVVHDMGAGWHCDVFQSHDGSRLAQWEQKLYSLPAWLRPVKRGMIRLLPRYHSFRRLIARQYGDPRRIVVAISKMVADDYQEYHDVPAGQIRLVYHGVDTRQFSPAHRGAYREATRRSLGVGGDELLLLFVGHDFVRKGLATAIRAVGRLARRRYTVRLAVVGRRAHRRYASLARRCGAGRAVIFLGPQDDPIPYYAAADAFLLPSFYDPFGLVVLEAAASGLPVVTSRLAGVSELLSDGVEGYVLADPADDAALGERLQTLVDPSLRQRMGAAGRQLALQHPLAQSYEQVVAVYREVVRSRRRAA